METAHRGLDITETDWDATVADFTATLETFNVGKAERNELFAILAKVKPDIVNAK
jgi:hypothetical protein